VAGLPSGDHPAHSANGAIEGQEGRITSDLGAGADDPARAAHGPALASREARARSARQRVRAVAETDSLTGARTRAAGLTQLAQELDRCRRTGSPLVVVRVAVVGLQAICEREGDEAADQQLARCARITRDHMRPYDLVSRHAGDEFLCAMSSVTASEARERFVTIAVALADAPGAGAIRTGFAELAHHRTAAELVASASCALDRSSPHGPHPAWPVLVPKGRGEGRPAADPGPAFP
jgi:diguanylate cyclase (GGDEF)-like protein